MLIGRIYYENECIGILEIVRPVIPENLLSPNIPDIQFEPLMPQVFYVESFCGCNCADILH